ncbi:MAG TPA: SNF2-related protein, partial [Phnomibacter sp.]|nr:SNF2-related protein [Phnomibacter sp.]
SLQLMERGEFLMFMPQFASATTLAPEDEQPTITPFSNGRIHIVHRMLDKERSFLQKLTNLHTNFIRPERSRHLILKGTDVLRNNWFFLFMETMAEWGITVQGFEQLKQFKFNAARPSTRIRISSGVDWFDANVDIRFGDMEVRVADIKKALADKQSFVPLQDGTLGILPEEWIKKYSLLFKVGDGQQNNLRLNRFQFGVIDELYNLRDDEEIQIALEEKFERLRAFKRIRKVQPPKHLRKVLRPYQVTGFQWLHFLQEAGWGGILADDMGLGKTVQALAALEHFEDQHGTLKALVVCPTSLLYNWENEIKKFTPHLNYFIHHGAQRTRLADDLKDHHIIITTYGTLRSDIMVLSSLPFDYVVLDESQAIKNPHSKVAKAACLLQAQHRLCMSGTPLQNNTFDIFAQMNFLNPGLLGSTEYFRNEFATPIDKFGEQEQKEHLRKLLFPFILRRTKEQVAADLPEKTETVLYCEMGDEQRSIYNAYRNDYRDKVLGVIDSRGMERSQLTILQGLMKLRQICDSPAILNEEEKFPNHSIKLEELTREITENISDHKALVFSQFLGMLSLIKERLKQEGIEYEYFDGSTQIDDRQKAINNFQNNTNCRVFLISLKAGGVGLNLTAADYVYIVDPWWN